MSMSDFVEHRDLAWWILRIGVGAGSLVTGVDKYFNKLADWTMYLSPLATRIVPVAPVTFMRMVGVVEVLAGLMILSRWTRAGSYLIVIWLLGVSINLATTGMFYDLALRDLEIAVGALALSQLTLSRSANHRFHDFTSKQNS